MACVADEYEPITGLQHEVRMWSADRLSANDANDVAIGTSEGPSTLRDRRSDKGTLGPKRANEQLAMVCQLDANARAHERDQVELAEVVNRRQGLVTQNAEGGLQMLRVMSRRIDPRRDLGLVDALIFH